MPSYLALMISKALTIMIIANIAIRATPTEWMVHIALIMKVIDVDVRDSNKMVRK